jgi:hypothetical protein
MSSVGFVPAQYLYESAGLSVLISEQLAKKTEVKIIVGSILILF